MVRLLFLHILESLSRAYLLNIMCKHRQTVVLKLLLKRVAHHC